MSARAKQKGVRCSRVLREILDREIHKRSVSRYVVMNLARFGLTQNVLLVAVVLREY